LRRGNAEVEQSTIKLCSLEPRRPVDLGEVRIQQFDPITKPYQSLACELDRLRIPIQSDQSTSWCRSLENRLGMPTATERGV
jgi:hypothetical protein